MRKHYYEIHVKNDELARMLYRNGYEMQLSREYWIFTIWYYTIFGKILGIISIKLMDAFSNNLCPNEEAQKKEENNEED